MRIWNPRWTDICVVIGPNKRWAEIDTLDLFRWYPEKLLGYRVYTMSVDEVAHGRLQGMRPAKIIVSGDSNDYRGWMHAREHIMMLHYVYDTKVEYIGPLTPPRLPWEPEDPTKRRAREEMVR